MLDHLKSWRYVFNSQNIFPADFFECKKKASEVGYTFFTFNGNVYSRFTEGPEDFLCSDTELDD